MTTTTAKPEKITITLSDRRPVTIVKGDWPLIAEASWFNGEHEFQANRKAFIKVRQHDDGRTIVYASLHSGPGGVEIGWRGAAGGFIVPSPDTDEIVRSIRRCAGIIDMPELADECIADLPAEDLS